MSDSDLRKAAQAALEALRMCVPMDGKHTEVDARFKALRAALAQPEPEPVAWWVPSFSEPLVGIGPKKPMLWPEAQPLYSNQPAQPEQQDDHFPDAGNPVAWLRVSNISGRPTGAFLTSELDRVMLRTERLVPMVIRQHAEPVECARCGHMNWIMPGKAPCQITEADKAAPSAQPEQQADHSPDAGKMVSSQQGQAAPTVETGLVVMRDKVSRRWYVYSSEHKGVCTLFRVVSGPFGDQSAANAALAGLMKAAQPQAEPVAWLRVSNISGIASGAFLPGELGGVELRSERLVPLMIVPGKNAS